ncbi:hypothetical protein EW146_g9919 [Bondarzewia mesenterica]|uniref:Uncharacterized protein n=1 Tax=Bondarzewia mesenterica TaxID=1095465 RepID=A0A4S4L6W7_9AGAM|nr:hypothetical protein EW146_g9919 [Bondarzewia mesenterica]
MASSFSITIHQFVVSLPIVHSSISLEDSQLILFVQLHLAFCISFLWHRCFIASPIVFIITLALPYFLSLSIMADSFKLVPSIKSLNGRNYPTWVKEMSGVVNGLEDGPIAMWAKLMSTSNEKWAGSQFNALEDLFAILIIHRIDEAMRILKNLRPVDDNLKTQDEELVCMAMLWSLPAHFDAFRLSLNLIDNFTRSKLEDAFRNEEITRTHRLEALPRI